MTTASPPPGRKSLLARLRPATWRGCLAWVGGVLLAAVVVCWILMRLTPSWYRPLDPADQRVNDLSSRAQTLVQYDLHNALQKVPLGEQTWTITQDEVNSLLATVTAGPLNPDGTRQRVDERISDPFVVFQPGTVSIAARIKDIPGGGGRGGVGTLTFSVGIVEVKGERMGQVKLMGVSAGDLPIPKSLVENRMHDAVPALVAALQRFIAIQLNGRDTTLLQDALRTAGEGQPFPLEYRIDRKHVVIREIRVDEGRFTVVLAPPPAAASAPASASATAPAPFPATRPTAAVTAATTPLTTTMPASMPQ